jgi:hypothetical protein
MIPLGVWWLEGFLGNKSDLPDIYQPFEDLLQG